VTNPGGSPPVPTRGGSFEEALENGRDLIERHPAAALQQAETLLRTNRDPRAFGIAAAALRRLGNPSEAEQAELSGIHASLAIRQLDEAAVARHEGRHLQSRALVDEVLAAQPGNLLALTMAAELDIDEWSLTRAQERLGTVLQRAPTFLRAILLLAKSYAFEARLGDAIDVFESVVERKPGNLAALTSLAQSYGEANRHEEAAQTYHRLLDHHPNELDMWLSYAHELRTLGKRAESTAAFRHALSLDPDCGAAWWGLANYFPQTLSASDMIAMEEALARRQGSAEDGGPIHVALGVLADRRGDHAEAFRHIAEGKRLRALAYPYDPSDDRKRVEELVQLYSPELFASLEGAGFEDPSPIFIVGMPRSGTTLLERILSRHPQIEAAGELPIIPRLDERLRREGGDSAARKIEALAPDEIRRLGQWYIERSRDYRRSNTPRFIDKMNSNWFRAGLIRLMLPNARIIDLRRNALDCCWSNFKMMFSEAHVAGNDQRDIARTYRNYVRMMNAVEASSPGGILRVRYEDLVADVETEARRILDFLGLEWDAACIDFHLSAEAVATPSSEQVRRPVNRDSVGSAEHYRQWLGPMIEELGNLAD
jgi:tetratricopeptide (TPR) repeat protein